MYLSIPTVQLPSLPCLSFVLILYCFPSKWIMHLWFLPRPENPLSLDFPFHIHFNTSVTLDLPFSLIIHPFSSALLIFLLFFSCLTVWTLAQDSTHAFNLGGRQPRSAASLQLRNFPPSPRSAHMLADGRREKARGVKLLPSFTPLLWHG